LGSATYSGKTLSQNERNKREEEWGTMGVPVVASVRAINGAGYSVLSVFPDNKTGQRGDSDS